MKYKHYSYNFFRNQTFIYIEQLYLQEQIPVASLIDYE